MSSELCYRVKVFSFGDSNEWEDLGTGIISKDYIEVAGGEILTITVRSEADNSIIIQSKILPDRQYKLQEVIKCNCKGEELVGVALKCRL